MRHWVCFATCLITAYFSPATCITFPVKISQAVGNISRLCPQTSQPFKDSIASTISDAITNIINPKLNVDYGPVCGCGGKDWTKVADVNMTNTNQQCPTTWNLYSSNGIRGCGRQSSTNTCDSVLFPVDQNYSRVCGKIEAYRRGDTDGFLNSIRGINSIEQSYIDGVSVTYGSPGSRRHIWTFVAGDNGTGIYSSHRCSCSISTWVWPHQHQIPSFIGDNYFCDNGNPGLPSSQSTLYPNPLWDGEGCTYPSTCCQFHNPPWFCVSLPQPTSDPIEVRLCLSETPSNEDIIITLVDLYVR